MSQRLVRDLMRIRHGLVVSEQATLREVAERLIVSDCDLIAVTDRQGKLAGTICESAVVRSLMSGIAPSDSIQSVIIHHTESARIDDQLDSILALFRSSVNTALPVVDDAGFVRGLIVRQDVINCLLNQAIEQEGAKNPAKEVRSEVPGNPGETKEANSTGSTTFRLPVNLIIHPAEGAEGSPSSLHQKPYFLRAEKARQLLWNGEDRL